MSTRLGHTRFRVWIYAQPANGSGSGIGSGRPVAYRVHFPEQIREDPNGMPLDKSRWHWVTRKEKSNLSLEAARALRDEWIDEARALHETETGERQAPTHAAIMARVEKTKPTKADAKPKEKEDAQASLF